MNNSMFLQTLLTAGGGTPAQQLALFALLNLGLIEALANGLLSATHALRLFFHAENCLYVRKHLRDKAADAIMSHGVQLPDVFDVLPRDEAHREFQRELAMMRDLCLHTSCREAIARLSLFTQPLYAESVDAVSSAAGPGRGDPWEVSRCKSA